MEQKEITEGSDGWMELALRQWDSAFVTESEKGLVIKKLWEKVKKLEGGKK